MNVERVPPAAEKSGRDFPPACDACRVGWRETPATVRNPRTGRVFCGRHAMIGDVPLEGAARPPVQISAPRNRPGEVSAAGAVDEVRERAFGEPRGF